jgi:hypothetical protein
MKARVSSLIACLNIGLIVPAVFANGIAWHLPWIAASLAICLGCYFLVPFIVLKATSRFGTGTIAVKALESLGYMAALFLAYFSVMLMFKSAFKGHPGWVLDWGTHNLRRH